MRTWRHGRFRRIDRTGRLVAALLLTMTMACDASRIEAIPNAIKQGLLGALDDGCGPTDISALVPECPFPDVCFTSACEAHDQCYGTCGVTRYVCDNRFYFDLTSICLNRFTLGDPLLDRCQGFAINYWSAVVLLGQQPYDASQELACQLPLSDTQTGACCRNEGKVVCDAIGTRGDCPDSAGLFFPELSCEEVSSLIGSCNAPSNDICTEALTLCEDAVSRVGLGRCTDGGPRPFGGEVCDLALQDCTGGTACVPYESDVYRCRVTTDNRLAGTDGPESLGGLDSFEDCNLTEGNFQADIWFRYTTPCSGDLTIRMCAQRTYDAVLAAYGSTEENDSSGGEDDSYLCPSDDEFLLACNDDFCGPAGTTSGLTVEDLPQGMYLTIRVGGFSPDGDLESTDRGVSELDIGMLCDLEN